jgi:hypothetical protein
MNNLSNLIEKLVRYCVKVVRDYFEEKERILNIEKEQTSVRE